MDKTIYQEKSDEELNKLASQIIDLLKDCNVAEKFKIISSLNNSLKDTIQESGGTIFSLEEMDSLE